jgi:hypothetical protein
MAWARSLSGEGGARSGAARIGSIGLQIARDWVLRFNAAGPAHDGPIAARQECDFLPLRVTDSAHFEDQDKGMQTEISPYDATGYRDRLARLALQRANIMHLVDLKRGGYSPRRTEMRIGRLTARPRSILSLSKSAAPDV